MTGRTSKPHVPLAVVGIGAIFPGSAEVCGFWRDIVTGRDHIKEVPPTRWLPEDYYELDHMGKDKFCAKRGAFLSEVEFDPVKYGLPPKSLEATDTSQLLGLAVAEQTLLDATGGELSQLDKDRTSIILGSVGMELMYTMSARIDRPRWLMALRESGVPEDEAQRICEKIASKYVTWQEGTFPGALANVVPGRIANRFDLGGTNCATDAACASSFAALSMAAAELYLDQSVVAISGGVDTLNTPLLYMAFAKSHALSPSSDCKPFSEDADGTLMGEGLGMIALKRLDQAERDGDRIYAVLRGIAGSSDGRSKSIYAPSPEGQKKALRRTYEIAGYSPATVELLEAHGTATIAGDLAEFESSNAVFLESGREDRRWCALGSIKSQFGHTKAAAGAAGLLKGILALHHKVLPPTIKVDRPNPKMDFANSAFYLNTQTRPWIRSKNHPRRAGVSSFGFGGTNFHVALEEYTGPGPKALRLPAFPSHLVLITASSPRELIARCQSMANDLGEEGTLAYLARSSQESLDIRQTARLAVVASDEADLEGKLDQAVKMLRESPEKNFAGPNGLYYGLGNETGGLALLFSGQGSQYPSMGADLAMAFEEARAVWDLAADIPMADDLKLHEVVFPIPVFSKDEEKAQRERLTATEWAQPGVGAVSASQLSLLRTLRIRPDCMGGHSFGELTALYAAGVMDERLFLALARRRGELMAEAAVNPGAMAAVFCSINELQGLLNEFGDELVIANHNAPRQVVVSGGTSSVETFIRKLEQKKIRCTRIPTSTAFHSSIVASCRQPWLKTLQQADLQSPRLPVFSNSEASPYPTDPDEIAELLASQVVRPVRFVEMIEAMYTDSVRTFVEVGSSDVLTKLTRQCLEGRPHVAVNLDKKGWHGVTTLWHALAALVAAGVEMEPAGLWTSYRPVPDPRKRKKPAFTVKLTGANYNDPYPPKGGVADLPKPNPARKTPVAQAEQFGQNSGTEASSFDPDARHERSTAVHRVPSTVQRAGVREKQRNPTPVSRTSAPASLRNPGTGEDTQASTVVPPSRSRNRHSPIASTQANPSISTPLSSDTNTEPRRQRMISERERLTLLQAYQQLQEQTADAHMAYLRGVEASYHGLNAILSGEPAPSFLQPDRTADGRLPAIEASPMVSSAPPSPTEWARTLPSAAPPAGQVSPTFEIPQAERASAQYSAPRVAEAETPPPSRPAFSPAGPPASEPRPLLQDIEEATTTAPSPHLEQLKALLVSIVAEKTGYPEEMLEMDLELEGDLGIDSIKRVEILSALQERAPDLPQVDGTEMEALQTLGEIVEFMHNVLGSSVEATQLQDPAQAMPAGAPRGFDLDRLEQLLVSIVAEKTGYPEEMLEMDLELEGDLGIDSIKRVEILSALQERAPDLPQVDGAEMEALQTLGEIVEFMHNVLGSQPQAGQPQAQPQTMPAGPSGSFDLDRLEQLLVSIVAEKTGYPEEMLEMDLELEGDLGIDSIKRVEILSALQERAPDLPQVDGAEMEALQTLGEIVEFMRSVLDSPVEATQLQDADEPETIELHKPTRLALREIEALAPQQPAYTFQPGGLVAVTDEQTGVAQALADRLKEMGCEAVVVDDIPEQAEAVVFLGGLRAIDDIDGAVEVNREGFRTARAVARNFTESGGLFVTVQDTGGDFGLSAQDPSRAWLGGLSGLAKTAAREWGDAVVKAIDLERGERTAEELADALAREIAQGGDEIEVGLHADGRRTTLESYLDPNPIGEPVLDQSSVIVASGGARGVTAASLVELAREVKPRLVLMGRTMLEDEPPACRGIEDDSALKRALLEEAKAQGKTLHPKELGRQVKKILAVREVRETLDALRKAGAEALYLSVDVTDSESVVSALAGVREQWGPITGIVHAAGLLADKLIADKTDEQFDRVFDTKVNGLRSLLSATREDPIKLICLFASVTARWGNAGQCDYAMANEILNKVAQAETRSRTDCRVKSLNWGPWEGGMTDAALRAHFEKQGIVLIPIEQGTRMFVDEILGGPMDQVEVVLGMSLVAEGPGLRTSRDVEVQHILVSAANYPFLDSHRVRSQVVLPMVLVQEWFARTAKSYRPDLSLTTCKELDVLKGALLEAFETEGDRFQIHTSVLSEDADNAQMQFELRRPEGTLHYRAVMEMSNGPISPSAKPSEEPLKLEPAPCESPYHNKNLLFHGPDFQIIQSTKGLSGQGAIGFVAKTSDMNWSDGPWQTDPALLEGGLQLTRVWAFPSLGESLPTRIRCIRYYQRGLDGGPYQCTVRGEIISNEHCAADFTLLDGQGAPIIEVEQVEFHAIPKPKAITV